MKIFNFFKKHPEPNVDTMPQITRSLFVDDNKPNNPFPDDVRLEASLQNYLKEDHRSKGMNDGFDHHSKIVLEISKQKMKAEFRFFLDKAIEALNQRILDLKGTYVEVKDLSPDLKEKIEISIDANQKRVAELTYEKELSASDEGWVMKLIYNYEIGFIHGTNTYIEGEDFLKAIQSI